MLSPVLVTNHVLSGAVLAAAGPLSRSAVAAFGVGVASHFALDRVRHWGNEDPGLPLRVAVPDGLAVLAGMAGAAAPDLDKPSTLFFGTSPYPAAVDAFHRRIQNESPRRMPQEIAVAAGLTALAVLLLRRG